jgi:cbb3-type cytochrome oxidase subunit 3
MNELEDIKLKALLQNMKLESPEAGFSARVMNQIFEENNALERIKAQRVLGKGFWLILALFVVLLAVIYFVSGNAGAADSTAQNILPSLEGAVNSYENIFSKIGKAPLSIVAILFASSILLFADRIISSNTKLFAK